MTAGRTQTLYHTDRAGLLRTRRRRKAQADAIDQARRRVQEANPTPLDTAAIVAEAIRLTARQERTA